MPLTKETETLIRKYAIKNAIDYGEARMDNVLGKVIKSVPKDQVNELRIAVERAIREVNALSKEQLEQEYGGYSDEFEEQYERKVETTSKPKMVLEGAVKGNFATRFPPEPSGYMYLGHAKPAFLEQEFARIYEGKLFLYFDDTNPEKEKQEFVDAFKRDLEWLGIKFDKEYYASDNLAIIYDYARKLIKSGNAYACDCAPEETKKERFEGTECRHRNTKLEENLEKFESMLLNKYDEGKISIRFKGDMKSNNTALRDPTILRIKKAAHYRQGTKYVVWPTYDFNTPINDYINGVTDAIRSKEYELRDELDNRIMEALNLPKPRIHSEARLTMMGQPKSKRYIRKLIDDGYIKDVYDPRLVTIVALRRRGIQPEAIREFVLGFGMSKADSSVIEINKLLSYNKKIIDSRAKRLYYVPGPVDLKINDFEGKDIEINLHPTNKIGSRKYTVKNNFYISGDDAASMNEHDIIKLKELFAVRVKREDDSWVGEVTDSDADKRVQWVCDGNYVPCSILVPTEPLDSEGNFRKDSLRVNEGYVESYAKELKEGEIVQFERFGFCILDDKKKMQFIFISK